MHKAHHREIIANERPTATRTHLAPPRLGNTNSGMRVRCYGAGPNLLVAQG